MKLTTVGNLPALPDSEPRQLVSDLFHALSQPLTSLCCSLELTMQQSPTPEQYRESVSRALVQAEHVSWLASGIRELFDASEAGEDCEALPLQTACKARSAICCQSRRRQACGFAICPDRAARYDSKRSGCGRDYFICWDLR